MKNQKEIQKLSEEYWAKQPYNNDAFTDGYNACLKEFLNTIENISINKYTKNEYINQLCSIIKHLEAEIIINKLGIEDYSYVQMMTYTEKLLTLINRKK